MSDLHPTSCRHPTSREHKKARRRFLMEEVEQIQERKQKEKCYVRRENQSNQQG